MGLLNLSSRASSRVATAGLVGLAVLDVVLVAVALRSTGSSDLDPGSRRSSSASGSTAGEAQSPSSTGSGSPGATAPATGSPATTATTRSALANKVPAGTAAPGTPLTIMLVALDDRRAWRVQGGTCSAGGATLSTTTDGGRTWADAETPLRSIVRVRPTDSRAAFVIGGDAGCVAELRSTADGGRDWGPASSVGGAWFRDPQNPEVVGGPGTSTSRPCAGLAVLDLAVLSSSTARVLCADGGVRSTTTTGSSWSDSGQVTAAVALAVLPASPEYTYVVRVDAADCDGIQLWRVDRSVATACIRVRLPDGPGQISISLVKGGGWLAVGDTTMRSTDNLATWSIS